MKFSSLVLPSIVSAQAPIFTNSSVPATSPITVSTTEQSSTCPEVITSVPVTDSAVTTPLPTTRGSMTAAPSNVTETITTMETITSCPGGCTNGAKPTTLTRKVTYTTTYCPDPVTPTTIAPISTVPQTKGSETSTVSPSFTTETQIETITTCPGGCSEGATTLTSVRTLTTTWCPESSAPVTSLTPDAPSTVQSSITTRSPDSPSYTTLTQVETITTCHGGCSEGATTLTSVRTLTTTWCPDSSSTVEEKSTSTPTPETSYGATTETKTITTCPGGCTKGATTLTSLIISTHTEPIAEPSLQITTSEDKVTSVATVIKPTHSTPAEHTETTSAFVPDNAAGSFSVGAGVLAAALVCLL